MHMLALRYLLPLSHVFTSMVLGVAAFAACAVYYPQVATTLIRHAGWLREQIVSISGSPSLELISRTVLHESSILLMFFTLMARILISIVSGLVAWMFGARASDYT
jgi:hypothetical protein